VLMEIEEVMEAQDFLENKESRDDLELLEQWEV